MMNVNPKQELAQKYYHDFQKWHLEYIIYLSYILIVFLNLQHAPEWRTW